VTKQTKLNSQCINHIGICENQTSLEDLLVRWQQTNDVVAAKGGERSVKGRNLSAISARQAKQIPIRNLLSGPR
jgi:hypothetical protein